LNPKLPSAKVTTQLLVTIIGAVVVVLGNDMSWADALPDWVAALVAPALGAIAAYFKIETRPTTTR
jgi:hypothetical protein